MWQKGDRAYYVLPKGYGRPQTLYLAVEVINATEKRVVVRTANVINGGRHHRILKPSKLVKDAPEGAWIK